MPPRCPIDDLFICIQCRRLPMFTAIILTWAIFFLGLPFWVDQILTYNLYLHGSGTARAAFHSVTMADYLMTIDSDDESSPPKVAKVSKAEVEDASLNLDFVFDLSADPYADTFNGATGVEDVVKTGTKPV